MYMSSEIYKLKSDLIKKIENKKKGTMGDIWRKKNFAGSEFTNLLLL